MEDHSERILQSCFIWESKRKAQRMVSILHKKSVYKGRSLHYWNVPILGFSVSGNFFWESRTFLLTLKQIFSLPELLNTGTSNRYGISISVPLKIFNLHDFPIPCLWTSGRGERKSWEHVSSESIWDKVANIRYRKYYLGKYLDFRECSSWSGFLVLLLGPLILFSYSETRGCAM